MKGIELSVPAAYYINALQEAGIIEICLESAEKHFKSAHQVRNRSMVDRSDLVIFCIEHNSGGAYQTMQYAKKADAKIMNLPDVPR